MGRPRVYGYGDRGRRNAAAREQALTFWAAIIIGVPVAVVSFIADHFVELLKVSAILAGVIAFFWAVDRFGEATGNYVVGCIIKAVRRAWAYLLARITARKN